MHLQLSELSISLAKRRIIWHMHRTLMLRIIASGLLSGCVPVVDARSFQQTGGGRDLKLISDGGQEDLDLRWAFLSRTTAIASLDSLRSFLLMPVLPRIGSVHL